MDMNNENLESDIQKLINERKRKVKTMMQRNEFTHIRNPTMDDSLKYLDKIVNILRQKKKYIIIEKREDDNINQESLPTLYNKQRECVYFYDKGY